MQAFGDAPFGPEALESPTAYLNALAGTEVTVQGTRPMTGRIVRAEPVTETANNTSTQRTRVTLLSTDGLRRFDLEDRFVQITDPALRDRIEHALESLRRDASLTTRHLTIHIKGKGERTVAIGYVTGAPLWKAILPPDGYPHAFLHRPPARLGDTRKPIRCRLEWRDADVAIRQPCQFPAIAVSQLFRAAVKVPGRILAAEGRISTHAPWVESDVASTGAAANVAPRGPGTANARRRPDASRRGRAGRRRAGR